MSRFKTADFLEIYMRHDAHYTARLCYSETSLFHHCISSLWSLPRTMQYSLGSWVVSRITIWKHCKPVSKHQLANEAALRALRWKISLGQYTNNWISFEMFRNLRDTLWYLREMYDFCLFLRLMFCNFCFRAGQLASLLTKQRCSVGLLHNANRGITLISKQVSTLFLF